MKSKQYPSQNEIKELFEYRDGGLYWKVNKAKKIKIGHRAGSVMNTGYRCIVINSRTYLEHRLIWVYFNGDISNDMEVDHINRIKIDNRIENLRIVSLGINALNKKTIVQFKTEYKKKPYRARFNYNHKEYSKYFETHDEATKWIAEKKSEIFEELGLTFYL